MSKQKTIDRTAEARMLADRKRTEQKRAVPQIHVPDRLLTDRRTDERPLGRGGHGGKS